MPASNAAVNAVTVLANAGSMKIYEGTKPASTAGAIVGTLIVSLPLSATAFATAAASVASANAITSTAAVASTTTGANYFRIFASDGTTPVMDGSVGTAGCDLNLPTVSIASGVTVSVSSFTYTQQGT